MVDKLGVIAPTPYKCWNSGEMSNIVGGVGEGAKQV